jgi:hypothetical protein
MREGLRAYQEGKKAKREAMLKALGLTEEEYTRLQKNTAARAKRKRAREKNQV